MYKNIKKYWIYFEIGDKAKKKLKISIEAESTQEAKQEFFKKINILKIEASKETLNENNDDINIFKKLLKDE